MENYKKGDVFKGTPNSKHEDNYQLFKPKVSYVLDNKTMKIVSVHKTPNEAIKSRNDINPNFKIHFQPFEQFKKGGDVGINLFEDYENIPKKVQTILEKHGEAFEDGDYKQLEKANKELNKVGYTFEYDLDGQAYDLRPIGTKGKSESEQFKKGGDVIGFTYSIGGL
jgi:hypothetical protein